MQLVWTGRGFEFAERIVFQRKWHMKRNGDLFVAEVLAVKEWRSYDRDGNVTITRPAPGHFLTTLYTDTYLKEQPVEPVEVHYG